MAIVRYRSVRVRRNINMIVKIFCVCSSVNVCGNKAGMDTYKIQSSLDRVDVSESATGCSRL